MPKIVNHDEYRQEMLEKCFYFFGQKGYANITMKDIAAEIGVSTGTLYHYFPSKEKMLGELISWAGLKSVNEYNNRLTNIESIQDRLDMFMVVLKESAEFYQNIMLLAVDIYRHSNIEQVTILYNFFSEGFVDLISDNLNVSKRFARCIYICIIGIIFNSLAVNEVKEYKRQIDFIETIFRPFIVDAPDDMDKAAQKIGAVYKGFLSNMQVVKGGPIKKKTKNTKGVRIKKNHKKVKTE